MIHYYFQKRSIYDFRPFTTDINLDTNIIEIYVYLFKN